MTHDEQSRAARPALVLAGGMGLGAYQAGVYEELHEQGIEPGWLAASSAGAINAALIAGNPPEDRVSALRRYWLDAAMWSWDRQTLPVGSAFRHLSNWLSAIQSRLAGAPGYFRPRLPADPFSPFRSLYDLAPMHARLKGLIDFDLLNAGRPRVSIATTDIESGEPVIFDTAAGDVLRSEHLLASCGFLPEFAPVEIGGRLLGDGGLSINAPFEPVLDEAGSPPPYILVVDLFARDGSRPTSLETALARKTDLTFANQTVLRLQSFLRGRTAAGAAAHTAPPIFYLSYRAVPDEAGSEKMFDLSRRTAETRWRMGRLDMQEALKRISGNAATGGLHVIRRPAKP
jgi:NTE family protein